MDTKNIQSTTLVVSPAINKPVKQPVEAINNEKQNQEKKSKSNDNLTAEQLTKMIDGINNFMDASQTHLKFEVHDKLERYYVKIVDDRTNNVIKEIPPKKMLDLAAKIQELAGILIDEKW